MWQNFLGASKFALFIVFSAFIISCGDNILSELSNENTDAALFEEAKLQMNKGNFTLAVAACADMSATATNNRDVAYTCASAYAGDCGLNFLNFLVAFEAYMAAPVLNVMMFLSSQNHGATATNVTSCATATNLLQSIGAAADRTSTENLLMVFTNLTTLGVMGNTFADTDDDDVRDPAYDTCTDIVDADAAIVAEAFWEIKESAGSTGIADLATLATTITTACGTLPGANDFCAQVDPDAFTLNETKGAEGLFRENTGSFGLGDCNNVPAACVCP